MRHLYLADELLFHRLGSIHNLYFIVNLVKRIRRSILDGDLLAFEAAFMARYAAPRANPG
jgi:queuine tRNA-ribosyltransferase